MSSAAVVIGALRVKKPSMNLYSSHINLWDVSETTRVKATIKNHTCLKFWNKSDFPKILKDSTRRQFHFVKLLYVKQDVKCYKDITGKDRFMEKAIFLH